MCDEEDEFDEMGSVKRRFAERGDVVVDLEWFEERRLEVGSVADSVLLSGV